MPGGACKIIIDSARAMNVTEYDADSTELLKASQLVAQDIVDGGLEIDFNDLCAKFVAGEITERKYAKKLNKLLTKLEA